MNNFQEIQITRPLATQLLTLAQKSPVLEICGLVGAITNQPTTVYPIKNTAKNAATDFEMDPKQQIQAFESIREKGEHLFAIYHSHPNSQPLPSAKDIAQLSYPEAYQLIISLNTKGVLEMRAYQPSAGALQEVCLSV